MKTKECILTTFLCICFSLAVMYGFFELGGDKMEYWRKMFCTIVIGLIAVVIIFSIIAIWNEGKNQKNTPKISSVTINNYQIQDDFEKVVIENLYILDSDSKNIPNNRTNFLITNFKFIKKVEKLNGEKKFFFIGKNKENEILKFTTDLKRWQDCKIVDIEFSNNYVVVKAKFENLKNEGKN